MKKYEMPAMEVIVIADVITDKAILSITVEGDDF